MSTHETALELIRRRADGAATDADTRALEVLLREDAGLRGMFVDYLLLDAALMLRGSEKQGAVAAAETARIIPLSRTPARPLVKWVWAMAASLVAAALIAGFVLTTNASASPTRLLQLALKVHAAALDRCYRVGGKLESARDTRLWTRGDRFWIESRAGGKSLAWGRDEEGRVWFTASPESGAIFDADEVPERLAEVCELRSLQVESLLRALLADFDLRREADAAGGTLIHAELKSGHTHPRYRAALLEVDGASGVLWRVEVERIAASRAPVPVTFTLLETGLHDEASYTLAGHLSEHATIYDRHSGLGVRGRALADFLALLWGRSPADASTFPVR